jgi:vacuolar protein sorting-associated protein 13A/C
MVFESVLVDIINKYLKPYVKKIDSSNLNIGVWNGNVNLKQLELKEDILADFHLPVKIGASHVEEITLKVPWKKLAREPTIVTVTGVYLVVAPDTVGTYDVAKEKKNEKEAKTKKLKELEEARKKKKAKEKDKDEDSFAFKMTSHIVKNLLVTVRNIHVRFEDSVTVPGKTMAGGITLDSLTVRTTSANWRDTLVRDIITYAYKRVELNSLAVYFDPGAESVLSLPHGSIITTLSKGIPRADVEVPHMYILRPMSAVAKVTLNLKPEVDTGTPLVAVAVECKRVDVDFSKAQYLDVLTVSEAMDSYAVRQKYVKYRPRGLFKDYQKKAEWWRFAYNSIMENDVRPKINNWSWSHIKAHRIKCRVYTQKYLEKLKSVRVSNSLEKELESLEDQLDVFNIMLCRKIAREQKKKKKKEKKQDVQTTGPILKEVPETLQPAPNESPRTIVRQEKKKGFFARFKSKSSGKKAQAESGKNQSGAQQKSTADCQEDSDDDDDDDEAGLSDKEKERLEQERIAFMKEIGYDERSKVQYPPEYVGQAVSFQVDVINMNVFDGDERILNACVNLIGGNVLIRPTSKNVSVKASVSRFSVMGVPSKGSDNLMITSEIKNVEEPLMSVEFEVQPLDKSADFKVRLDAQPVLVIFDVDTVDALIGAFKIQKAIHFRELTDAATATGEQLRDQAKAGLEAAMKKRKLLDVEVKWQSPYIIVPQNGSLTDDADLIVISLGQLKVYSEQSSQQSKAGRSASSSSELEVYYDTFNVELRGLQALVVPADGDWLSACIAGESPFHILPSMGIDLALQRSILQQDAFIPSMQLTGRIGKVPVVVRDDQLARLLKIVLSLPLPTPAMVKKSAVYDNLPTVRSGPSMSRRTRMNASALKDILDSEESDSSSSSSGESLAAKKVSILKSTLPQLDSESSTIHSSLLDNVSVSQIVFTQIAMNIGVEEVSVSVQKKEDDVLKDFLQVVVGSIGFELTERTWDRRGVVRLKSVEVIDHLTKDDNGKSVRLVQSGQGADGNLGTVVFTMVDKVLGKDFAEKYTGLKNSATLLLATLSVKAHSGTVNKFMELATTILPAVKEPKLGADLPTADIVSATDTSVSVPEMDFTIDASFSGLHVEVVNKRRPVTALDVRGLKLSVNLSKKRILLDMSLNSFVAIDSSPGAKMPKMISIEDENVELVTVNLTKYNNPEKKLRAGALPDLARVDLGLVVNVQKIRFIALQSVIEGFLDFVAEIGVEKLLSHPDLIDVVDTVATQAAKESRKGQETEMGPTRSSKPPPLIKFNVTMSAPAVVLPTSNGGGILLDMGSVCVDNRLEYREDSSVAVSALKAKLSEVQIQIVEDVCRWNDPTMEKTPILQPMVVGIEGTQVLAKKSAKIQIPTFSVSGGISGLNVSITADIINELIATGVQFSLLKDYPSVVKLKEVFSTNTPKVSEESIQKFREVIKKRGSQKRENTVSGKFQFSLNSGELVLKESKDSKALLSGVITGLGVQMNLLMESNLPKLDASVTLKDLCVVDLDPQPPSKLVSSVRQSEGFLDLQISVDSPVAVTDRQSTELVIPPPLASLKAKFVPLRILASAPFGLRMAAFAKKINIPVDLMKSAVSATKEATTAAVRLAKDHRLDVDVVLEAPVVCVPLSVPNQALVINMGVLKLKNKCERKSVTYQKGKGEVSEFDSVFEIFDIALDDFSIMRSLAQARSDPESSFVLQFGQGRALWHPLHIHCNFTRNMCTWIEEIPAFAVSLNLGDVKVSMGSEDIDMFMEFALDIGNRAKAINLFPTKDEQKGEEQDKPARRMTGDEIDAALTGVKEDVTVSGTQFKAEVNLNSFVFDLFFNEPSLTNAPDGAMPECDHFTTISVHGIHLSVAMEKEQRLEVEAALQSFNVADCRPKVANRSMGKEIIRRYSDSSDCAKANEKPLFFVQISRKDRSNFIFVKTYGLLAILELDYIRTFADNMIALMKKNDKIERFKELGKDPSGSMNIVPADLAAAEDKFDEAFSSFESLSLPQAESVKFQASLHSFRLALVEDSTKERPTALVLKCESFLHVKMNPFKNQLQASVQLTDFGVSACCILEIENALTHVLLPMSMAVDASGSTDLQELDVHVRIDYVTVTLSPALVQLMTRIAKSFIPEKKEEKEIVLPPKDLWEPKPVNMDSWFLLSRKSEKKFPARKANNRDENINLLLKHMEVRVEGNTSKPLLALVASADGSFSSWTSEPKATLTATVEASYFNEALSVWEPLLEPTEHASKSGKYRQWSCGVNLTMPFADKYEFVLGSKKTEKTIVEKFRAEPRVVLDVSSQQPLELTVTRSAVSLLKGIAEAYSVDITKTSEFSSTAGFTNISSAPVTIYNKFGPEYELTVKPGSSFTVGDSVNQEETVVNYNQSLDLKYSVSKIHTTMKASCSALTSEVTVRDTFTLKIPHHESVTEISVVKDGVFLYDFVPTTVTEKGNTIQFAVEVCSAYGKKLVTVRSCFQVVNELSVDVDLLMTKETSVLKSVCTLKPGESFPFPIGAVRQKKKFSVIPSGFGFAPDSTPVDITDSDKSVNDLSCFSPDTEKYFNIRVVREELEFSMLYEWRPTPDCSHYTYHLRPAVLLHNLLPYTLEVSNQFDPIGATLQPGDIQSLCFVASDKFDVLAIKVKTDDGEVKKGGVTIDPLTDPSPKCTAMDDLRGAGIHVHCDPEERTYHKMYVYAPVWVVNKTGQTLRYMVSNDKSEHLHTPDETMVYLLPNSDESTNVKVCVDDGGECSSWSKSLPLKATPISGNFAVKHNTMELKLGISLKLSSVHLTRILTFTPYYMLSNQTSETVYCKQAGSAHQPMELKAGETSPFIVSSDTQKMQISVISKSYWSKVFSFEKSHATVLNLRGVISAVIVSVEASDGICTISFSPYYPGCTPVRVINMFSATFIEFRQAKNQSEKKTFLSPGEAIQYTWDDPTGTRAIHWNLSNTPIGFAINVAKDGSGQYVFPSEARPAHYEEDSEGEGGDIEADWMDIAVDGSMSVSSAPTTAAKTQETRKKDPKGYWVSFFDGIQRTLVFTERLKYVENVRRRDRSSSSLLSVSADLSSIGLSVVHDLKQREIIYLGLRPSELIWQLRASNSAKFTTVPEDIRQKLELAYQSDPKAIVKDEPSQLHVSLESMQMFSPIEGQLRRTRHSGLNAEARISQDLKEFEFVVKSGYMQVDNQLPVSLYPHLLYPIPPPPSVGSYAFPPFAEAKIVLRTTDLPGLFLVKYCGAAIENMRVGVDFSVVAALMDMFTLEASQKIKGYLDEDKKNALIPLKTIVENEVTASSTKLYIGEMEIAPVKAKMSFSSETVRYYPDLENTAVNTALGVFSTVTAFQDSDFNLAALHIGHEPSTFKKLIALFKKHYISQSVFQVYAVILGLDVIGNPVSFVRGFAGGTVDLFYEPVKAGIHGNLGGGLLYGGKSFLGGTVGGVAGAGAKVTGSLGNVVAKLTFDKDHQESRIQEKKKQDSSMFHRFGGLAKSMVRGVTGVVTQPMKGGKEEGAFGVVKGIGKGTAGLLLRPIGGIIDFTSSNLTALQQTTSVYNVDIKRLRSPRYISVGSGVKPYSSKEAFGLSVFQRVTQGSGSKEVFLAHKVLEKDPQRVALITNKRIIIAEYTSMIDVWREAQEVEFALMTDMPLIDSHSIIVNYESGGVIKQCVIPSASASSASTLAEIIGKGFLKEKHQKGKH